MDGGIRIKKLTIFISAFIILLLISGTGVAANIIIQPGGSTPIQNAVNSAKAGDIIILKPGVYSESVKVSTKSSITIKSESGNPDNTEVKSISTSRNALSLVNSSYIQINGLKFSGAKNAGYSGISVSNCSSCKIQSNKLVYNSRGLYLVYSKKCTVSNNIATDDDTYGIVLANTHNSTISGNQAHNNARGLYVGSSDSNMIFGNNVSGNSVIGFFICGYSDRNSVYNNYFNDFTVKNGIGNSYNTAKTTGPNIIGGSYIGGNFWGNPSGTGFSQTAKDANGDGFSDEPYKSISGSIYTDNLPLTYNRGSNPGTALNADFSGTPLSGDQPLTVSFSDGSSGSPTSWKWEFGDGNSSTEKSPKHTYYTGKYDVTLIVTNSTGVTDTEKKTSYINVAGAPAPTPVLPVAGFSGAPTSGTAPLTVTFKDESKNAPTSWSWDFGDKTTSSEQNPKHTYNTAGNYIVKLTATNSAGSNTTTKTNYITVTGSSQLQPPVVKFWGSRTSGAAPLTVYFTDNSTNSPTSWSWNFGDNTPAEITKNPKHIYTAKGNYTVTLIASNAGGPGTLTRTNYIKVS